MFSVIEIVEKVGINVLINFFELYIYMVINNFFKILNEVFL